MTSHTSQLAALRRNLAALGSARRRLRGATAWSAVATSVVGCVLAFWALDVLFEMSVAQRLIMLLLSAGAVTWIFRRLAAPLLGIQESEIELALQVERQQDIDSDLVAALQFEHPDAANWGSTQLEGAVIRYVSNVGQKLNVFAGFDSGPLRRRARLLGLTAGAFALLCLVFPGHAGTLFNRLLLGHRHYPTRTTIAQVIVNQQLVLHASSHGTHPDAARAAQSHPVRFWIQCAGVLPEHAQLRLTGDSTHAVRQLDLVRLSLEERRARLAAIDEQLAKVAAGEEPPPSGVRLAEIQAALRTDAPEAHAKWPDESGDGARWREVVAQVQKTIAAWPGAAESTAVYQGELGRLVDSVSYKLYAGDAWTDPASVAMIPLPVVEPRLEVTPPAYAAESAPPVDQAARQVSVLEGSRLDVAVECTNRKPLAAAWITWQTPQGPQSLPLAAADDGKTKWRLPVEGSPFAQIRQESRFDLQVRDHDGLQLETPIGMLVRIRADRPPTGSIDVVHRVVLPGAKPKIEYRVNDDYGIGKIALHVETEPGQNTSGRARAQATSSDAASEASGEPTSVPAPTTPGETGSAVPPVARRTQLLLAEGKVLGAADLPRIASYEFDLKPLALVKGDRLKLTLEVVDHRGAAPGETIVSDPLYLEISDESGVLAAILEADEKSEQRLSDIIKRQLGIGESP